MSEPILHHYEISPYSEKIRAIFGYKNLAWHSVITPEVMPKGHQLALTGGYRKTPVMQIGRDVYCDTRLIAAVLERLQPQPPLLGAAQGASAIAYDALEPILFFAAVAQVFTPAGLPMFTQKFGDDFLPKLFADRQKMFQGGSISFPNPEAPVQFAPIVAALEAQLAASGGFLGGASPALQDFICYHCLWFIDMNPGLAAVLQPYPATRAWLGRIRGFGHGKRSELEPSQALAIARDTRSGQAYLGAAAPLQGVANGQRVTVSATDYGGDPVSGTLLYASTLEIAIGRSDPKAGDVVVHFPRSGFKVVPAA